MSTMVFAKLSDRARGSLSGRPLDARRGRAHPSRLHFPNLPHACRQNNPDRSRTASERCLGKCPGTAHPELAMYVRGYQGYFEASSKPVRRRELPSGDVALIISFGPR